MEKKHRQEAVPKTPYRPELISYERKNPRLPYYLRAAQVQEPGYSYPQNSPYPPYPAQQFPQMPSMQQIDPYRMQPYPPQIALPLQMGRDRQEQADCEYWKSMYPTRMRHLQQMVDIVCDRIDYENSPIYDEYPDAVVIQRMCREVEEMAREEAPEDFFSEEMPEEMPGMAMDAEGSGDTDAQQVRWPNRRPPRPGHRPGWNPQDIIRVLLVNELYRRRCHHRNCRRFY